MGKSSKKLKSDKINALRKQYDAFLDEDRKRKSRNEYILGWLDKVRSVPTLTPTRRQPGTRFSRECTRREREVSPQNYPILNPSSSNTISTYTRAVDDTKILKEISKSYILIPKRHSANDKKDNFLDLSISKGLSTSDKNDNCPDLSRDCLTNDADWKSKYNILQELKNEEKGERVNKEFTEKFKDTSKISTPKELSNINTDKDITSEKDIFSENTSEFDNSPNREKTFYNSDNHPLSSKEKNKKNENEKTEIEDVKHNKDVEEIYIETKNIASDKKIEKVAYENSNSINPDKLLSSLAITTNECEKPPLVANNVDAKKELLINLELSRNHHETEETESTLQETDSTHSLNLENNQPIIETNSIDINNESGTHLEITEGDNNIEIHSHAVDTSLGEPNNQYSSDLPTNDTTMNNVEVDQSQIEEYETEQKELFYSEQPHENYAYNEESGQNIQNNEVYENNEQYSYYETVKEDNNYTAEINEHAETTERYDPNYEQQYANQYNEDQTQYPNEYVGSEFYNVPEQNSQYEQHENYDQQNYEYQQQATDQNQYDNVNDYNNTPTEHSEVLYEQNTPQEQANYNESTEQVEQQMDMEEGYSQDVQGTEQHGTEEADNVPTEVAQVDDTQEIKQTT